MPPCGLLHGGIAQGAASRKLRFAVAEGPVLPTGFDQIDYHVGLEHAGIRAEIASDGAEEGFLLISSSPLCEVICTMTRSAEWAIPRNVSGLNKPVPAGCSVVI